MMASTASRRFERNAFRVTLAFDIPAVYRKRVDPGQPADADPALF
jgi:hypothetical protein